jgi:ElaB/YqjD/DUF883 family membrane-anchored ribosome-binding protein
MAKSATHTSRGAPGEQGTSQVQEAASAVQDKAVELKEQGRNQLGQALDRRTNETGTQARQMAQVIRESGERLRQQEDGVGQAAVVADGAADRIERLGEYLEQASGDELLRDVEDFARRRPWFIAGIGFAVGLAASRFLKASSERRYTGSKQFTGYTAPQGPDTMPSTGASYVDEPLSRESYSSG